MISSFIPENLRNRKVKNIYKGRIALALVDISGFTTLSETLANKGREGSEEVTVIINSIFYIFIDIIKKYGGEIVHFSGDAISIIIYEELHSDYKKRILFITKSIMDYIRDNHTIYTESGNIEISMHAGISSGIITRYIFNPKKGNMSFLYSGKTMNNASKLLDKAQTGQIAIDKNIIKDLKEYAKFSKMNDNYYTVNRINYIIDEYKFPDSQNSNKIKNFICKELIDFIEEESSFHLINTHKRVCIAFINIEKNNINDFAFKKTMESILESISKYGGFLDKCDFNTIGDKLMIAFGAPKSISDIEEKAIRFIFEVKNVLQSSGITYKIGLESGYAFCGIIGNDDRREYTIMGNTVNTAARIMSLAEKNEILISNNIMEYMGKLIDVTDKGIFKLKGKKIKVSVYGLTGNLKSGLLQYWTDNINIFSGRKKEIIQINRIIDRVLKSNKELLVLKGKSGTGKSILISKIISMIQDKFVILILRCREFNKTIPFSIIKIMLLQIAGLSEDAETNKIIEQLTQYCSKEQLKYIRKLFSKGILRINKQNKELLFNALSHILNEYFKGIPLSVIFDDYQWIDAESEFFFKNYLNNNNRESLFSVISSLPSGNIKSFESIIDLNNFSRKEIAILLKQKYQSNEISRVITPILFKQTNGHPLFVNEFLNYLESIGVISGKNKNYKIHLSKMETNTSDKIENFIAQRIDDLPVKMKKMLRIMSIFGDNITLDEYKIISNISSYNMNFENIDIIDKTNDRLEFRNHIIRQSIYNAIPFSERRDMHIHIINLINKKQIRRNNEFIAAHMISGNIFDKALPLCIKIAEKHKKQYSLKTSLYYYETAISLLDKISDIPSSILNLLRKEI